MNNLALKEKFTQIRKRKMHAVHGTSAITFPLYVPDVPFLFLFFIGLKLLDNAVLFSAVQHEPAICAHVSPPSSPSPAHPTSLGHHEHQAELPLLAATSN